MFYNNKFATKNHPQRQLTKKWPKRHFAEEVNRNENLQNVIQSHNLQTRCCQDQQGVAEMLSSLREKCFENLEKEKLKKKLSERTICKKVIKNDHLQKMIKINKFKTRNIKKIDAKFVLFT